MKTKFIYLLISILLISCGGDDENPTTPNSNSETENKIPNWNKNNTAVVYIASNFEQKALTESNYNELSKFLKISDFNIAILNQSNVDLTTNFNGGVAVTNDLKLHSFFNVNGFENKIIKGNTTIIKTPIEKITTYSNLGTYISNTETNFNNIDFPVSIATIDTENKLSTFKNSLNKVVGNSRVLFIETKNTLISPLKDIISGYSSTYRVQEYKTKNNSSIVVICPKYWLTREVTLSKEYTNNMDIYKVQIEANVFY